MAPAPLAGCAHERTRTSTTDAGTLVTCLTCPYAFFRAAAAARPQPAPPRPAWRTAAPLEGPECIDYDRADALDDEREWVDARRRGRE